MIAIQERTIDLSRVSERIKERVHKMRGMGLSEMHAQEILSQGQYGKCASQYARSLSNQYSSPLSEYLDIT